jgi:Plasmid stabilization system protein
MNIEYSLDAVSDLRRLREFIMQNNPAAAARIGAELLSRIENLALMPLMGYPVQTAPDPETIRDMIFGNYIVRYAVTPKRILILRLWHHYENR